MKEKRSYKRFEMIPFLAILGCAGMLVFESIFIFELYSRVALRTEAPAPAVQIPAAPAAPAAPVVVPAPVEAPAAPEQPVSVPAIPEEVPAAAPVAAPVG